MKRFLVLALAIVALASPIVACGSTASGNDTGTAVTPGSSTSSIATAPTAPKTFTVGNTVSIGGWQVQVHSVKTSAGSQFNTPQKAGDVFLLVDVTVSNASGQSQTLSSIGQFSLRDATGQAYTQTVDTDAPSAPDGTVANGAKLRGTLVYEVPKSTKQVSLEFSPPAFGSSDQATWMLSVK